VSTRRGTFAVAVSDDYLKYVLGQLEGLSGIATRRMFGAVGLYSDSRFFALISDDTLYFKVNDANRAGYEARSMRQFRPYPDREVSSMNYYEVPADVLEDPQECVSWARQSVAAAKPAATRRNASRSRSSNTRGKGSSAR
jgi:DNA transformation protein